MGFAVHERITSSRAKRNWEHSVNSVIIDFKKNFMAPFYGWGSTAARLEPLRGGSLQQSNWDKKKRFLIGVYKSHYFRQCI